MEIEVVIKGGEELSEHYPKNYEAFREKIGDLIIEMFPGVDGWCFSSEPTGRHKKQEEMREKRQEKEFEESLIRVLKSPEGREIIRGRVAVIGSE